MEILKNPENNAPTNVKTIEQNLYMLYVIVKKHLQKDFIILASIRIKKKNISVRGSCIYEYIQIDNKL